MPRIRVEIDVGKLLFRNAPPGGIEMLIEATMNLEAGLGGGRGNEFNNDVVGDQRLATPVLGDKGKEPMLNLVPLASLTVAQSEGR
jgi:hypothetical protein